MPKIPASINGVAVDFGSDVGNDVAQTLIDGLTHCIKPSVAHGHALTTIFVSSAFDSHKMPSRHMQHKAVDISRVNGLKIVLGYPQGGTTKAIVDAIQDAFEGYAHKRENFGPHLKKKEGKNHSVTGHNDHIHLSVN
jgi:hypothetical protein